MIDRKLLQRIENLPKPLRAILYDDVNVAIKNRLRVLEKCR